jgi:hypothetical protein
VGQRPESSKAALADLDLTTEAQVAANAGTAPALAITPYDPSQDRERLRGKLAGWLLALLAVIAVGSVAALIFGEIDSPKLKDILTGVFTPLLGVFGTITGFYFGNAQASQPPSPPVPPVAGAPVAGAPVAGAPGAGAPVAGAPVADAAPVVGAPVADSPVVGAPVADSPVVGAPVADLPAADPPVANPPAPDAP